MDGRGFGIQGHKAIAAVVAGEVRHLLVWKLDRRSRRGMRQVDDVLDTFESRNARLVAHMDGLDSSVPQHRGLFAWLAEQARALLMTGESASAIAEKLNADGLTTRRGGKWRSSTITQIAHSPAWAGLLPTHDRYTDAQGRERWRATQEPMLGESGQPVSVGEGAITVGERARIQAAWPTDAGESLPLSRCIPDSSSAVAPAATWSRAAPRTLLDVDDLLVDLAIRWLAVDDPEKDVRRTELTLAVDDAQARLDSLDEAHFVHRRFKGPKGQQRYDQLRDAIAGQLDALQGELAELTRAIDITVLRDGEMVHQAWMAADQERARMLLRVVLRSVALLPSRGQGCKDPVLTRLRLFHWVGKYPRPTMLAP
ncbi:recombinase family protein [Streptomyces sp. NRRL S-241]|uniref:recombinase family protein n=1 Tax=Streptomyces sp. NRRL S-241 TaxID=1463896 RepID=UPI0004C0E090|nr:recombinase family protein [Streptomyces sp. NRRL S-241]